MLKRGAQISADGFIPRPMNQVGEKSRVALQIEPEILRQQVRVDQRETDTVTRSN